MDSKSESKLTINIDREQHIELKRLIPWGLKSAIFRNMVKDLIVVLKDKRVRARFIDGILSRQIKLNDYNKELLAIKKEDEEEK